MFLKDQCLKPPAVGKPYMLLHKSRQEPLLVAPFSKSITHAFVLEFATQEDLDYYITENPVHWLLARGESFTGGVARGGYRGRAVVRHTCEKAAYVCGQMPLRGYPVQGVSTAREHCDSRRANDAAYFIPPRDVSAVGLGSVLV